MVSPMTDWDSFAQSLASRHRQITEGLAAFVRMDTVSQEPERVRRGAEWLAGAMRARGIESQILETGGNPAVFGQLTVPGARHTVLIYCHYDVKPAPIDEWR